MFPSNGETDVLSPMKSFAYEYVIDAFDVNRPDGSAVEAITGFSFFTPREAVASVPYDRRIFKS